MYSTGYVKEEVGNYRGKLNGKGGSGRSDASYWN